MSHLVVTQNQNTLAPTHLLASIDAHIQRFDSLFTFADVADWDSVASGQARQLTQVRSGLQQRMQSLEREIEEAQQAHTKQPFFRRLFSASPAVEIKKQLANLTAFADKADRALDLLQAKIDFSPNDIASKKTMLAEARQRKKELQLEKKQLSLAMQAIRTAARQQSANAPYSTLGIIGGRKMTAIQRQAIRHAKEQAIGPHEQEKARIDWELTQLDHLVLWLERIR